MDEASQAVNLHNFIDVENQLGGSPHRYFHPTAVRVIDQLGDRDKIADAKPLRRRIAISRILDPSAGKADRFKG